MKNRHTIALNAVTLNTLRGLAKYRETMDDVVLRLAVFYANSNGITNEQVTYALSEYKQRFGKDEE